MNVFLVLIFTGFLSQQVFSAGAIPLGSQGRPATDVQYKGALKTPDELVQLRQQGVDLSDLNPAENTDLWKNRISAPLDASHDQLEINLKNEVSFLSSRPSRLGALRFAVKQEDERGQIRFFTVLVSKANYNFLLRKALLRKLGYAVPAIQYASQLKLRFKGTFSKTTFLTDLKNQTVADPERWVTNLSDTNSEEVHLQDVLIFSSNETTYNLATGFVPSDIIQGRRLLNSLSIVYGLTEVPGTINGFAWKAGRILDQACYVDFDGVDEFSTPSEDAKWILKRIAQLKVQDFKDIVSETHLPEAVQALLVEKLLARTNSLLDIFSVPSRRFPFDAEISWGSDLKGGILQKTAWPGYGSLFSSPHQPTTPLSETEISAFFKSKINSSALASLMNTFDSRVLHGTNIEKKVIEQQIRASENQLQNFIQTGEVKKIPFGIFAFPTVDADINISRDVVVGQYMGTDNLIQLADTFEVTGAIGVFASAVGLPSSLSVAFQSGVRLTKTYTHLKPTQSIVSASQEPYRNLFVQKLLKKQAGVFDELLTQDFSALPGDQKQERITALLKDFNQNLKQGESFIVSRSLTGSGVLGATMPLATAIQIQASVYAQRAVLSRLHFLKINDSTIHVYRDQGENFLKGLGIGFKAYIPVLSFSFSKGSGKASTDFYKVNLNPNMKENPEITSNLVAIRQALEDSSLELLNVQVKPVNVEHRFDQKTEDTSFLFYRNASIETTDEIRISDKENSRLFYTSSQGQRQGRDYQGFVVDIVNSVLSNEIDKDLVISNIGSGDAGDTYRGQSFLRKAAFELENRSGQVVQPFMTVRYNWKGWKASAKKMQALIEDVNAKFGATVFQRLDLYGTSEFQLYSVDVNLSLYQDSLMRLLNLDPREISKRLKDKGVFPKAARFSSESYETWTEKNELRKAKIIQRAISDQARAQSEFKAGNFKAGSDRALDYISVLEGLLPFEDFVDLVGGEQGFFLQGRIYGFRDQQENGDVPIISDSIGRLGSDLPRGGLSQIQQYLGLSNSEFLGLWLIRSF